jgi:ethanolamine ammonia-lyase small subunit
MIEQNNKIKDQEKFGYMLESKDKIYVDNPHNMQVLEIMKKSTSARICIGRCGTRLKTSAMLNFLADHASACDAVLKEVSKEFLVKNDLFQVQTLAKNKDEYLKMPQKGRRLNESSKEEILKNCEKRKQVQIIVADGLSSTAIEENAEDTLMSLLQGLKIEGISTGKPFFVKYGRVGVEDDIAILLDCDVIVELVGERPGLNTAEGMSAYMIYRPTEKTVEADRTVISNIHRQGTPPPEAGAQISSLVKNMLKFKASGIKLSRILQ